MGGTGSVDQFTAEDDIPAPPEESCETTSQVDEDELSAILEPVKERVRRRRRRRQQLFQERRPQLQIVEGDNEDQTSGGSDPAAPVVAQQAEDEEAPAPLVENVTVGSMLSKLQRFKIKAEDRRYGHARTFKLIKDNARRRRNWRRHLSGDVLMSAVFERSFILGVPIGGRYNLFRHCNKKKIPVGHIVCSGWIDGSLNFFDAKQKQHGRMTFGSGYAGTLMRLHLRLPRRIALDREAMTKAIIVATKGRVLYDICHLITGFLTPKDVWSDVPKDAFAAHKNPDADYVSYTNKKPTWNEDIRAYTLEFGGRALLPSVHNFQLSNDRRPPGPQEDNNNELEQIHMQLGKLGTVDHRYIYFNCDVHTSLSMFHAFATAVCVLQRTFIAE